MSYVPARCWPTVPAIAAEMVSISRIVAPIPAMASAACAAAVRIASICARISPVALAVWPASALTSPPTMAKPRPASLPRAASIVALSARRFVWLAMRAIRPATSPIRGGGLEGPHRGVGAHRVLGGQPGDGRRTADLGVDLGARRCQFLGSRGDHADIRRGLLGGGRDRVCTVSGLLEDPGERAGALLHRIRGRG